MRPTGTGLKRTAEAWGQTDPCVLLRAQVWCISTLNTSSFPSRGNWHILKAKQLGCNIQANQGAYGPLFCLAVFFMHCIRPNPNWSRQFESPGEIKNFCCYTLKQNNSPQLYTLITLGATFSIQIPLSQSSKNFHCSTTARQLQVYYQLPPCQVSSRGPEGK